MDSIELSNQLMNGNFINYLGKPMKCDIKTILAASQCQEQHFLYTPIAITDEWLLKFGFLKTIPHGWYEIGFEITVFDRINEYQFAFNINSLLVNTNWRFRGEEIYKYQKHITSVKYVHQIQNLYYLLSGTKLKITNPNPYFEKGP